MDKPQPKAVVGGFAYPRPGRYLEWGYLQWPLAKLVVSDAALIIGPRGALGKIHKPLLLRSDEIERIEIKAVPAAQRPLDILIQMRLRLADPSVDRTKFWSSRRRVEPLLEVLKRRGIVIEPVSLRNRH